MKRITVQEFADLLLALPAETREKEIQYIDFGWMTLKDFTDDNHVFNVDDMIAIWG